MKLRVIPCAVLCVASQDFLTQVRDTFNVGWLSLVLMIAYTVLLLIIAFNMLVSA